MDTQMESPMDIAMNPVPEESLRAMYERIDDIERQAAAISTKSRDLWRKVDQGFRTIDTTPLTPTEASALRYSCAGVQEEYVRLLLQLDATESFGNENLRARRKEVVKGIQSLLEAAEFQTQRANNLLMRIKANHTSTPTPTPTSSSSLTDATTEPATESVEDPATTNTNTTSLENTDCEDQAEEESEPETKEMDETELHEDQDTKSETQQSTSAPEFEQSLDEMSVDDRPATPTSTPADQDPSSIPSQPLTPQPSPQPQASQTTSTPRSAASSTSNKPFTPRANVADNNTHWLASVLLPNVPLRDVSFDIKRTKAAQFLTVSGVRHQTKRERSVAAQLGPLSVPPHGPFSVTFKFPLSANLDDAEARLRGDELLIVVPKALPRRQQFDPFYGWQQMPSRSFDPFRQLVW